MAESNFAPIRTRRVQRGELVRFRAPVDFTLSALADAGLAYGHVFGGDLGYATPILRQGNGCYASHWR